MPLGAKTGALQINPFHMSAWALYIQKTDRKLEKNNQQQTNKTKTNKQKNRLFNLNPGQQGQYLLLLNM